MSEPVPAKEGEGQFVLMEVDWDDEDRWRRVRAPRRHVDRR